MLSDLTYSFKQFVGSAGDLYFLYTSIKSTVDIDQNSIEIIEMKTAREDIDGITS